MFVIAMDHTIAYGVGGMVLFASEVGLSLRSSFKHLTILIVWNSHGQPDEHRFQISSLRL